MRKTKIEEFRKSLLETGGYETPDDRRAPRRAKPGALTTLGFSLRVCRVFPMCALYEPLGILNTDRWARLCFSSVTGAERLGMKVILEGWRNRLECEGPVVYLCNHMSTVETILMPPVLLTFGPFNIVAKMSLSRIPFLVKAAAHMGMVGIGRKSPREDLVNLLKVGVERIQAGNSFLIFPQGTRQKVFDRKQGVLVDWREARREGRLPRDAHCRGHPLPAYAREGDPEEGVQGLRPCRPLVRHPLRLRPGDTGGQGEGHARAVLRLDGLEARGMGPADVQVARRGLHPTSCPACSEAA